MRNRSIRHDDVLLDNFLYRKDHWDFVKEIATSFNIYIYSLEQIDVARKSEMKTLYFYATGSLVRDNSTFLEYLRVRFEVLVLTEENSKW